MNKQILLFLLLSWSFSAVSQESTQVDKLDLGKMWTFEHAPVSYFETTHGFKPSDEWLDQVRMSALRFATWCSASFVSPDGLIMTNHHCSNGTAEKVQRDGENFEKDGFIAKTREEERKVEGLFVDQLVQLVDITETVKKEMNAATSDAQRIVLQDSAIARLRKEYSQKEEWKNLVIQPVTYYSGGRYSLLGYKRHTDLRLVFYPELQLGYFGGDPDNFTYPRYALDCSFYRAYDENGKPLNTSAHYFKFKTDGVNEGDLLFLVGNPGTTVRYEPLSYQLYNRDVRLPALISIFSGTIESLQAEYSKNPSDSVRSYIFGLSNSVKSFTGTLQNLEKDTYIDRKRNMENQIRSLSKETNDPWAGMEKNYNLMAKNIATVTAYSNSPRNGRYIVLAHLMQEYRNQLQAGNTEKVEKVKKDIMFQQSKINVDLDKQILINNVKICYDFKENKEGYQKLMGKSKDAGFVNDILKKSSLFTPDGLNKFFEMSSDKLAKNDDAFLAFSAFITNEYNEAFKTMMAANTENRALKEKVANAYFNTYGTQIPPDATFTLRISDGIVKDYEYNGTTAPYQTTFFGLYDRYYSFKKSFPWSLPAKWLNPSPELLRTPMNFVSTNDIIGGNSGSALVNKQREAVGLAFDSNWDGMQSNFIYDDDKARCVSVTTAAIVAAVRYIYGAETLALEMEGK